MGLAACGGASPNSKSVLNPSGRFDLFESDTLQETFELWEGALANVGGALTPVEATSGVLQLFRVGSLLEGVVPRCASPIDADADGIPGRFAKSVDCRARDFTTSHDYLGHIETRDDDDSDITTGFTVVARDYSSSKATVTGRYTEHVGANGTRTKKAKVTRLKREGTTLVRSEFQLEANIEPDGRVEITQGWFEYHAADGTKVAARVEGSDLQVEGACRGKLYSGTLRYIAAENSVTTRTFSSCALSP